MRYLWQVLCILMAEQLNKQRKGSRVVWRLVLSAMMIVVLTPSGHAQRGSDLPPGVSRRPARVAQHIKPAPPVPAKEVSEPKAPPVEYEQSSVEKKNQPQANQPIVAEVETEVKVVKDVKVAVPTTAKASKSASGKKTKLPQGLTPMPREQNATPSNQIDEAVEAAEAIEKMNKGIVRPGSEPRTGSGLDASITGRKDARTMTLAVPAPRGQITDRNGKPFAQTKVVWYPALKFGQFEKADRDYVISWARKRIAQANGLFEMEWQVSDEKLWQHYRHRRWLAMPVSREIDEERKKAVGGSLMSGLILHPVYMRFYPEKGSAAHIIGYVGSSGKLEKGPINYADPIFEFSEGRAGLEKLFDKVLKGKPGLLRKDYEADGTEVVKKMQRRPKPGGTVVTTLDLDWQNYAEEVLKKHCSRGAFVVIDIYTGEVLTMASRPTFDLNEFMPFISTEKYDALREDPGTPLFGRAFQGGYPPASTFKPIVALAALNDRVVSPNTLIYCPAGIQIGKHWFRNWTKIPEGDIDVKRAIARSCNTWFYQVGILTGASNFLSVARRLGFGSKTGLPLIGETSGLIPTNEWMKKHHGRRLMDGDTANLSIGQGVMLASPLQVAQGMAGIASGGSLPKLWLVKQIQDVGGRVLVSNEPKRRNYLNVDPAAAAAVQEGMMQVVNAGYGTGHRGGLSYTVVCGKTGTAQWGPESQNKRLAWFAGYFPYENPRFAFAALYEGKPNEKLSGGRKAAPMVSSFFEHFKTDIQIMIKPPPRALVIEEDDEVVLADMEGAPRAIIVEDDEDDGGLDPAMGGFGGTGGGTEGFVPEGAPVRPLTPTPTEDPVSPQRPWLRRGSNDLPPPRAIPVEEDPVPYSPPTRQPGRAIPVEE